MKKVIFILFLCMFILTGCKDDNKNESGVNVTRTLAENNTTQDVTIEKPKAPEPVETQIGTYTTNIYDKTPSRVNNIKIACDTLNGTIVPAGDTFSFCDTLGEAKPEDGYLPAATFDEDGDVFQDYGGGKCQISSTLYCVIKDLPGIVVTERHAHSKRVYYVPEGADAAVSYGSVDLKFRNDTGSQVRIDCSSDGNTVVVSLVKIS